MTCLDNLDKSNAIDFLYHLANNDNFIKAKIPSKAISSKLNKITNNISEQHELLFVFGNLNSMLSIAQKSKLIEQIQKINFKKINNERLWRVLYYYIKDEPLIVDRFKEGLIISRHLFHTGFNDDNSLSMGHNHINLSFLNNDKIWNASEAKIIYKKILSEIKKIEIWLKKRDQISFDYMFQEMLWFLKAESHHLENIISYNKTLSKIQAYYTNTNDYVTFTDAIVSNKKSKIIWAMTDMHQLIMDKKPLDDDFSTALQLLMNRILFQNEVALEATLNYIAVWIQEVNCKELFERHKAIFKLIFEKYSKEYPANSAVPFIQKQLSVINKYCIKYWKSTDYSSIDGKIMVGGKYYYN